MFWSDTNLSDRTAAHTAKEVKYKARCLCMRLSQRSTGLILTDTRGGGAEQVHCPASFRLSPQVCALPLRCKTFHRLYLTSRNIPVFRWWVVKKSPTKSSTVSHGSSVLLHLAYNASNSLYGNRRQLRFESAPRGDFLTRCLRGQVIQRRVRSRAVNGCTSRQRRFDPTVTVTLTLSEAIRRKTDRDGPLTNFVSPARVYSRAQHCSRVQAEYAGILTTETYAHKAF